MRFGAGPDLGRVFLGAAFAGFSSSPNRLTIKTMYSDTDTDEQGQNAPAYPTAADRQCLYLSQKLHEARQEIKALEADLALMGEGPKHQKEAQQ